MEKDLGNYRKSYEKGALLETAISDNPMELFQKWFHEVDTHFQQDETNAMTISTIGLDGYPKNRVVLLKKYTSGDLPIIKSKAPFKVVYSIDENEWNGRVSLQLKLKGIKS